MDEPVLYAIKDVAPFAVAAIGLFGVAATWLVTRRRNRVDKLRESWAAMTASGHEASDRVAERVRAEDAAQVYLSQITQKYGGTAVVERVESDVATGLEQSRRAAHEALWRLRRDYSLLALLETSDSALAPATSIVKALAADTCDNRGLNSVRLLLVHIALDNRRRFLHPWRRWRRWIRPQPIRNPAFDEIDAAA